MTLNLILISSIFGLVVNAEISISPYTPKNDSSWFVYETNAGDIIKDSLKIQNTNLTDSIVNLDTKDSQITDSGQYTILAPGQNNLLVGNWIKLNSTKISIPSNKFAQVPFEIKIPKDTKDGEYSGAVVFTEQKNPGENLDITVRKGVRTYLAVGKDLGLSGKIDNLKILSPSDQNYSEQKKSKPFFGRDNLVITYQAENLGNVFGSLTGKYSLIFPDGKVFENTFSQDLAPGVGPRTFNIISNQQYQEGKTKLILNYNIKPLNIAEEKVKITNSSDTIGAELDLKREVLDNFAFASQKAFVNPGENLSNKNDCQTKDCSSFSWSKVTWFLGGFLFLILLISGIFIGVNFYQKSKKV